jgi:hypothetical protein
MRFLGLLLLTAGAASAGEYALLSSGARMHVDRHELDGARVRLYNSTGYIEMPASNVTGFEVDEPPALAPALVPEALPPPPVVAPPARSPVELADDAADKYGLPRLLVRSLMPATAQDLGVDPHDPAQNVDAGVRYLRDLLNRYDGGLWRALAAYNAGPGAVDKYHWVPPYQETINYVSRIDKAFKAGEAAANSGQQ